MEKTFNPHDIEKKWYPCWEAANYFAPTGQGEAYCIMLPPPNVTGSLHMGHGFQHTLMDVLIRYHRMRGDNTLWQPGIDHAGIATQMVVERQLNQQGQTRHMLGREAFVDKVWEWKQQYGTRIAEQIRRLGASVDWTRERFTLDEGLSNAVHEVFVRLYQEGFIYRDKRLVNWDPVLHTALSDLEVITSEEEGSLWHIRYPLADKSGHMIVATTRPETLLGDVAVAVHPNDERYQSLIGKYVLLPLCARTIPIIADTYVDPTFGTGCVKITPGHDFNDYQVGKRHHLPLINIFTKEAHLNENAPEKYQGLDRYAARKQILADLTAEGLLANTEPHTLHVPRGDRSGVVIEPLLTNQWFMKMTDLARPAIDAVKNGYIRFVPENWANTYFQWMLNIQDWCISRQLWWGHRIPAWYDETGNSYVGHSEADVRDRYRFSKNTVLTQDEDVLDTWFSAALWPFSTLGWPDKTEALNTFYPTSVLITGFDIIFFWVARMVMLGLKFADDIPFKEVYITGLIRDAYGKKMSKSKGNVLDPIDLIDGIDLDSLITKRTTGLMQPDMAKKIEQNTRKEFPNGIAAYGADALRFTFCALASTGRDIRFDIGRMEGYRNFCNKLWNAARYTLMNLEGQSIAKTIDKPHLSLADRFIQSRCQRAIQDIRQSLDVYRFDLAANALHEFVWNEFCDWYLELCKPVLTSAQRTDTEKATTRAVLAQTFETILRLAHPFIPFITEEIWQKVALLVGKSADTIMYQPYPEVTEGNIDTSAESEIQWLKSVITSIRNVRGEMNISPGKTFSLFIKHATPEDVEKIKRNHFYLTALAKLDNISFIPVDYIFEKTLMPVTKILSHHLELLLPMGKLIDTQQEKERIEKTLAKAQKDIDRLQQKLSNNDFVAKAPADIVAKEREQLLTLLGDAEKLKKQKDSLL